MRLVTLAVQLNAADVVPRCEERLRDALFGVERRAGFSPSTSWSGNAVVTANGPVAAVAGRTWRASVNSGESSTKGRQSVSAHIPNQSQVRESHAELPGGASEKVQ